MEETVKILIYIHAFFGGLGLITGLGSIIVTKGSIAHKSMGNLFSIGMITSSFISMPIAWMPNHENVFLFLIGLFTVYMVVSGKQILTFKSSNKLSANSIDKVISGSMFIISAIMILIGVFGLIKGNVVYTLFVFFGILGLFLTIKDFIFYKNLTRRKNAWLINHIGKMLGAFIASVTAFVVAGLGFESIMAWIIPSVIGTAYIIYWKKKTIKQGSDLNYS